MRFSISSCASQWRSNISLPKRTVHFLVLPSKPWLCVHCIYQVNTSSMSLWTLQARSSKSPTKNIILFLITLSCSSLVLDSSHFPHLHLVLEFFQYFYFVLQYLTSLRTWDYFKPILQAIYCRKVFKTGNNFGVLNSSRSYLPATALSLGIQASRESLTGQRCVFDILQSILDLVSGV